MKRPMMQRANLAAADQTDVRRTQPSSNDLEEAVDARRRALRPGLAIAALGVVGGLACSHGGTDGAISAVDGAAVAQADANDSGSTPRPAGWWREATFYEIFVRSFRDSDGDGVGDFVGLTAQLDALNDGDPATDTDLGVTGLWLMPVFASPSYHGYDVTDYFRINPDYGTEAEFDAFIAAAHARGIRVILDLMINHTSNQHPWFLSAKQGPDAEFRDFYTWSNTDPGWTQPWSDNGVWHRTEGGYYYGLFWSGMPDLNLDNPEVETKIVEVMRHWLGRGVDGFRLDAAQHYFESDDGVLVGQPEVHPFMRRLRRSVAADHPNALFVAEVWNDLDTVATYYGDGGDEFQLAFGFDTASAILTSTQDRAAATFEQNIRAQSSTYADPDYEAPFITNHDMVRAMQQLGGDEAAVRVAAAALFAMPGTPFVYYGEEIGMRGGPERRDEDKRTPLRWTAEGPGYGFTTAEAPWHAAAEPSSVSVRAQRGVPGSLWTLYRDLIAVRRGALAEGPATLPALEGEGRGATAVLRARGDERILVVLNFDADPAPPFTVATPGTPTVLLSEGLPGAPTSDGAQLRIPELAGRAFAFLRLD